MGVIQQRQAAHEWLRREAEFRMAKAKWDAAHTRAERLEVPVLVLRLDTLATTTRVQSIMRRDKIRTLGQLIHVLVNYQPGMIAGIGEGLAGQLRRELKELGLITEE
jgi:hypothetical protein